MNLEKFNIDIIIYLFLANKGAKKFSLLDNIMKFLDLLKELK
ncbi:MAG: hypothetical protein ACI4XM_06455 [Candidatus Coprovivens sp.]